MIVASQILNGHKMQREDLWMECAWRMRQLQTAARAIRASPSSKSHRGRGLLRVVLRMIESLRQFTNDGVLLNDDRDVPCIGFGILADAAELSTVVSRVVGCDCPTRADVDEERNCELQRELAAVNRVERNQVFDYLRRDQLDTLRRVVMALREREQSHEFHRGILLAVKQLTGKLDSYSTDNFAFGSTPFYSWVRLCTTTTIQNVVQQWRCDEGTKIDKDAAQEVTSERRRPRTTPCIVFGSSSGSLVFFTSILLDVQCSGVEILPFLHKVANDIKDRNNILSAQFFQGDMLMTQIHDTRLLILTSQCWDQDVYESVIHKLEIELAPQALVVDYRDGLARSRCFSLHETVEVSLSWNRRHKLFLYKRRDGEK